MFVRSLVTFACVACVACVAGLARAPSASAQTPARRIAGTSESGSAEEPARAALRLTLDSLIGHRQYRNAQWGVLIVDPIRGDTIYSWNAGKLFVPASNEKVITAAVALATLGPDFRFSTRLATRGVVRDSVLHGDLVVIGSGDPSFSDHLRGDAMVPMRELADSVRARGIIRIDGRLRRGKPVFADAPIGFGWEWEDLGAAFGAPVGDLMFNESFAQTRISVDGVLDTTANRHAAYRNFLDAFAAALSARGVATYLPYEWSSWLPDTGLTTLVEYQSAPLRDLLPFFTKPSDNQIGEVLFKTLGVVGAGAGTADSAAAVVGRRLLEWGADSGGFVVHDGSGLSRHDLVTPETLVHVLDAVRRDSSFAVFYNAMPVAAVDGTLDRRMHGTAAAGNVHAKTGSMDRVRALSGYVTTADGRMLIFSIMANEWTVPGLQVEGTIDRMVERLAALRLRVN